MGGVSYGKTLVKKCISGEGTACRAGTMCLLSVSLVIWWERYFGCNNNSSQFNHQSHNANERLKIWGIGWVEDGSDANITLSSHLGGFWSFFRQRVFALKVLLHIMSTVPNRIMDTLFRTYAPSLDTLGWYKLAHSSTPRQKPDSPTVTNRSRY